MLKILQLIGGFFSAGGAITSFFAWVAVKFTSKAVIIGIQIATIVLLVVARVAFLIAVLDFSISVFNSINTFSKGMNTLFNSDSIISLGFKVLQGIGLIDAFMDAFAIFNVLVSALLLAWALKFAFHTSKMLSDQFFKLGVLFQA